MKVNDLNLVLHLSDLRQIYLVSTVLLHGDRVTTTMKYQRSVLTGTFSL